MVGPGPVGHFFAPRGPLSDDNARVKVVVAKHTFPFWGFSQDQDQVRKGSDDLAVLVED